MLKLLIEKNCPYNCVVTEFYEKKFNFNILPITYWNLTVGWPIPKNAYILHANWAINKTKLGILEGNNYVERKIDALRKLKKIYYNTEQA